MFDTILRQAGATKENREMQKTLNGRLVATLLVKYAYDDEGEQVEQNISIRMPDSLNHLRASLIAELATLEQVQKEENELIKKAVVCCYLTPNGYTYCAYITGVY